MNEVEKILKQNKLNGHITKENKIDDFLKNYERISFKKQQKFLMNTPYRDKNGFIEIENYPFISIKSCYDSDNEWLLFNNGARAFLKSPACYEEIENELIIMYFLKSLNINCANYEPVKLNGKYKLLSPSFLDIEEKITWPYHSKLNIKETYDESIKYSNQIHYLKATFSDRLYGNSDREPFNFGILTNNHDNSKYRICPLFDNGEFIFERDNVRFPKLSNGKSDMDEVINYLLSYEEIMHWIIGPGRKTNLYDICERLKREKKFTVNNDTYLNFSNFFKDSEIIVNKELKSYGKSHKIKLT